MSVVENYSKRGYHDEVENTLGEKGASAFESNIRSHVAAYEKKTGKTPSRNVYAKDPEGVVADVLRNMKNIMLDYEAVKKGDVLNAPRDISFGTYFSERFGIATDKKGSLEGVWKFLGLPEKNAMNLADLKEQSRMKFATLPEFNEGFRWLIAETILDPIRAVVLNRGIYRMMIESSQTSTSDTIVAPIILRPDAQWQQMREKGKVKTRKIQLTETRTQLDTIATGIVITDKQARNMKLNLMQMYFADMAGTELDNALTYEAFQTVFNGNDPSGGDAASVIGVQTTGTLSYDRDWLPLVIRMIQLGMRPEFVAGDANMVVDVMSLPEFKGFDGVSKVGQLKLDAGIRALFPNEYNVVPTGAMPAKGVGGGRLLFLDPMRSLTQHTSQPMMLESQRFVDMFESEHILSMVTGFLKMRVDSSFILDTSVAYSANPFPAIMNPALLQGRGYER